MKKEEVEQEIEDLKKALANMEDQSFRKYMDEELRDLRHRVLYVHTVMEEFMDGRINKFLREKPSGAMIQPMDRSVFWDKLSVVLDEMDFHKKTKVIEKFRILPAKVIDHIRGVNAIRVIFSHPSAYELKIKEYKNREKYLKALQTLVNTIDEINELFRKKHHPANPLRKR